MTIRSVTRILAFACFFCCTVVAQELTLDQILKKNEDAIGGADAISKVQTLRMTSRMLMSGGQTEMVVTVSCKRPNFVRTETAVRGHNIVWVYDGTTAWIINPLAGGSQPRKMDEADIARLANYRMDSSIGSLVGIKAAGNTIELLGKEDINGSPAYKLKVTLKGGMNSTYFLDAGTFLPAKIIAKVSMMGQEVEGETYPGNYKKVDGILFAHSMEAYVNGQTMRMNYDKIEVNVPLDDSIFKLPGTETPAIKK